MDKQENIEIVRSMSQMADKILEEHIVRLRAIDPAFRAALDMSIKYEDRLAELEGDISGSS